jgi:hypothetical protein
MPWVRIDEHFADHPKVVQAGPLAMALHVAALCYCNRFLTDGFIPEAKARTLIELGPETDEIIKRLVTASLWDQADGGYRVHDYLDYQPSKQKVIEERSKKRAAGQAGGEASAQARAQAKSNPVSVSGSAPGSSSVSFENATSPPAEDDTEFEQFWNAYPKRNGKRIGKNKALKVWKRLPRSRREEAMQGVKHYADACDSGLTIAADAFRWLRDKTFEEWQTPATDDPRKTPAEMGRGRVPSWNGSNDPSCPHARVMCDDCRRANLERLRGEIETVVKTP